MGGAWGERVVGWGVGVGWGRRLEWEWEWERDPQVKESVGAPLADTASHREG